MSVTYVGQLERGERDPGLGALKKLVDALGIHLTALFDDDRDASGLQNDLAGLSPEGRRLVRNMLREVQLYEAIRPRSD